MKKFPKKYIALQAISMSLTIIFFLALYAFTNFLPDEEGEVLVTLTMPIIYILIGVVVAIILFSVIYSVFYHKTHGYEITEDEIILKQGVIFKKKTILSFSKINNIKTKRNILHWIFGLEVLKLDSGSTSTGVIPEIRLVDTPENIKELEKMVKQKVGIQVEEEKQTEYRFTFKNMLGYSYGRYLYLVTLGMVLVGALTLLFGQVEERMFGIIVLVLGVLGLPLFCALICFIMFYKFSITRKSNSIDLSYGLFEKKKNTIYLDKVRAIRINQSLMQRILKTATLVVEVIGFGSVNEKESTDVVIPYFKTSELNGYMQLFFKEWDIDLKVEYTAPKRSFKFFVGMPMFLVNVYFASLVYLSFVIAKLYLIALTSFLLTNLIILLLCYLKKKNLKFGYNDRFLTITKGYFGKHILIINKKDIVFINKQTTPLRQKSGLASFTMVFFNTMGENAETINLMEESCFDELINLTK
ncbi:MAG: PH domain-containing protein [Clostridia bacterium]|nr:PH domain-containing protein [Clostridia bacterium]